MHKKAAVPLFAVQQPFFSYRTTPSLKMEISRKPCFSALVCSPLATRMTRSSRSFAASSMVFSPSAMTPVLKSIQQPFFYASGVLVEIFRVGAGAENGVPRPVENRIRCAPAAVMAVAETRSLPGP